MDGFAQAPRDAARLARLRGYLAGRGFGRLAEDGDNERIKPSARLAPAFARRGGVTLRAVHAHVVASSGRALLANVSADFVPGELCAVMGPSGCGKSTLLAALRSGRASSGALLANGAPYGALSIAVLVPQADLLLSELSALEMATFAAELCLPPGTLPAARAQVGADALRRLRLSEVDMRVRIGDANDARGGLSGGQRKRVAIALELLTDPPVLLADEPTSGLDASMAAGVLGSLAYLARTEGRTVVVALHAPSERAFALIDSLVLLTRGGAVAYAGPAAAAVSYFERVGIEALEFETPAELCLRALDGGAADAHDDGAEADRHAGAGLAHVDVAALWAAHAPTPAAAPVVSERAGTDLAALSAGGRAAAGCCGCGSSARQAWVLLRRRLRAATADRRRLVRQLGLKALTGLLLGVVWRGAARDPSFGAALPTSAAIFLLVNNAAMDAVTDAILQSTGAEARLLAHEALNGAYPLRSYWAALLCATSMRAAVGGLLIATPAQLLIGLAPTAARAGVLYGVLLLVSCIGAALGVTVGALTGDIDAARAAIVPTLGPLLIFSGFLLPLDSIPRGLRWAYYASFFQYALGALSISELSGRVFESGCPAERLRAAALAAVVDALGAASGEMESELQALPRDLRANITCAGQRILAHAGVWGANLTEAQLVDCVALLGAATVAPPPLPSAEHLGRAVACGGRDYLSAHGLLDEGSNGTCDMAALAQLSGLPQALHRPLSCTGVELLAERGLWPARYGGLSGYALILGGYWLLLLGLAYWALARQLAQLTTADWRRGLTLGTPGADPVKAGSKSFNF